MTHSSLGNVGPRKIGGGNPKSAIKMNQCCYPIGFPGLYSLPIRFSTNKASTGSLSVSSGYYELCTARLARGLCSFLQTGFSFLPAHSAKRLHLG